MSGLSLLADGRWFALHQQLLEVSEMCWIFREYWALATRNAEIEDYLVKYYRRLAAVFKDKLRPLVVDERHWTRLYPYSFLCSRGTRSPVRRFPLALVV